MKGIIALDIDGTLTPDVHSIPADVVRHLELLASKGWVLFFVTGRSFSFAFPLIGSFRFPFYLAVQNGSAILEMPSKKILQKKYLDPQIVSDFEEICAEEPSDFVVYTGVENQDICYYRPKHFEPRLLEYVEKRARICKEDWRAVETFDPLSIAGFPTVKCFGKIESVRRISRAFEEKLELHAPIICDPFGVESFLTLATRGEVSKGEAVRTLKVLLDCGGPVIAAGDDNNDLTMLEAADFKIVMETAPKELLERADLIAPSAEKNGIISALEGACKLFAREDAAVVQKIASDRDE